MVNFRRFVLILNVLFLSVNDFSVFYPSLCLQSTDDEVFAKRHMKQELEEKRRKR